MIKLKDKQEIILEYIRNGKSQRQISRETGISRETIRKYINEYEKKLVELGNIKEGDELIKVDLIDEIVKTPKYNSRLI
ncbi:helix-turn-helix domain-containing protein [Caloramator sp. ALD01]|uniref:helix-turn-helix domain-containing protein n=1 Tax=Caloramator sp. ALD01 TaxID=1031288 RepID=UPI000486EE05|nr:helix-turn-helix domain-containing protein [Caloramator sp. ALD01]